MITPSFISFLNSDLYFDRYRNNNNNNDDDDDDDDINNNSNKNYKYRKIDFCFPAAKKL